MTSAAEWKQRAKCAAPQGGRGQRLTVVRTDERLLLLEEVLKDEPKVNKNSSVKREKMASCCVRESCCLEGS